MSDDCARFFRFLSLPPLHAVPAPAPRQPAAPSPPVALLDPEPLAMERRVTRRNVKPD